MVDRKLLEQIRDAGDDPRKITAAYENMYRECNRSGEAPAKAFMAFFDEVFRDYCDNFGTRNDSRETPSNSIHNVTSGMIRMHASDFYAERLDVMDKSFGMETDIDMRMKLVLSTVAFTCDYYADQGENLTPESLYSEISARTDVEKSLEQQEEDRMNIGANAEYLNSRAPEIETDTAGRRKYSGTNKGTSRYGQTGRDNKTTWKGHGDMSRTDDTKPKSSAEQGTPGTNPDSASNTVADPVQADSRQADSSQADLVQAGLTQADLVQAGLTQTDSAQADSAQADSAQADSAQADSAQADSAQADSAQADSSQADSAQAGSIPADSTKAASGDKKADVASDGKAMTGKEAIARVLAAGDDPEKATKEYMAAYEAFKGRKDADAKAFIQYHNMMHDAYVSTYKDGNTSSVHDLTYGTIESCMDPESGILKDDMDALDKALGMTTDAGQRAKLTLAMAACTFNDYLRPSEVNKKLDPADAYKKIWENEPPQKSAEEQDKDNMNSGADLDDLSSRAPDILDQQSDQGQDGDGKSDADKDEKKKKKKKDDEEAEAAAAEEQERQKDGNEDGEGKEKQKKSRFTTEEWAEMAEIANGIVPDAYLRQAQVVERILYHIGKENYTYKSLTNVSEYLTDKKRATMAGRRLAKDFNAIQKEHAKLAREALELNNALYGTVLGKVKDHYKDQLQAEGEAENDKKAVDGARPKKGLFGGLPEKIKNAASGKDKTEEEKPANEAAGSAGKGQADGDRKERKSPVRFADMKIAVPFLMLKGVPGKIRSKLDEAIDKNKEKKKTAEECREGYAEAMADAQDNVQDTKGFRKLLGSIKGAYDKAMAKWRDRNDVNKYDLQDEDDKDRQTGAGKDPDDVNGYDDEDTAADDIQAGSGHGGSPEDPDSYDDPGAGDEYYVLSDELDEFDYSQFEGQELEDDEDEGQEPENEEDQEAADATVQDEAGGKAVLDESGKDMDAAQAADGNPVQVPAGDVSDAAPSGSSAEDDGGNDRSDAATISDLLSGMPTEPPVVLSKGGPQAGDASKEDVQADVQDTGTSMHDTGAGAEGVTEEELGEKLKEAGEAVPFDAGPVKRSTLAANLIADAENKEAANKEAERLLRQMGSGDGLGA